MSGASAATKGKTMKRTMYAFFALGLLTAACGGGAPETRTATPNAGTTSGAPATADEQVALGQKLYGQKCASCHGSGGQGDANDPAVVGKDALPLDPPAKAKYRKTKFQTAQDIAAFVKTSMPADSPGTLTDEEAYAILAFDLHANGVKLDKKVDPAYAAQIKLH